MLTDFHLHTEASNDSQAPIEAMCEAAIAKGYDAIAITDHVEMVHYRRDAYDRSLTASWEASGRARAAYADRLRVARGIELGEPLYDPALSASILDTYPFDFVLASMHRLSDEEDYYDYDYTGVDIGVVMDHYFAAVLETVQWGRFHSLAHLTYPFRYMPPDRRPAGYGRWTDAIDAVLRTLAEKGLALEINTSGLRNPRIGLASPDLPLVRRFREVGGEILTVGSDAHEPENVGAGIPEALAIAWQAGFRYTAVYFAGKPTFLPIEAGGNPTAK